MIYRPPGEYVTLATPRPVHERGPRMVTPFTRLGDESTEVDCPYCKKVVKTKVRKVQSDDAA